MTPLEEARLGIRAVDKDIAALFERRMHLVAQVALYKKSRSLQVLDPEQEKKVLERGMEDIADPALREYYSALLREYMALSRDYQDTILGTLPGITVGRGLLARAGDYFNLSRKVLVVTEPGVPQQYPQAVLAACPEGYILTVPGGEGGKTLHGVQLILDELLRLGFTRSDAVVAVGGGVVGDMAGYAAACYMRGIDYYNVPTTLLSQVDSSVGGKTAVNYHGVKNIVGAFHAPRGVLADTGTLSTLSDRLFAEGMAELVKMAATCDAALFESIENCPDLRSGIDSFVEAALRIKMSVVRVDPQEKGLRAVLNFGHTVGHAIEAAAGGSLYHGECVAIGMMYMSSGEARARLEALLKRLGLPVSDGFSTDELMAWAASDKKKSAEGFKIVTVSNIGSFSFETASAERLRSIIDARK